MAFHSKIISFGIQIFKKFKIKFFRFENVYVIFNELYTYTNYYYWKFHY